MQTAIPTPVPTDSSPPTPFLSRVDAPAMQRLLTVDLIRGFSLLGILLMNILGFGLPFPSSFAELCRLPYDSIDFRTFQLVGTVFEGTMRALFSMLFGAGILLFMAKKEDLTSGYTVADFYYRRLLWLILFGVINAYVLLWIGDILYTYALCGLLLFPFRRLAPRWLFLSAFVCLLISLGKGAWSAHEQKQARQGYLAAVRAERAKKTLTPEQQQAKTAWLAVEKETKVDPEGRNEIVKKRQSGYGTVFAKLLPINSRVQSVEFYQQNLWDALLMMFLGMALFRWGFFQNDWSTRAYGLTLLAGYGVGLTLGYFGLRDMVAFYQNPGRVIDGSGFPFQALYHVRRASTALGHASLLLLVYRSGVVPGLMRGLANVGQMAFTNYLMQSAICALVFNGFGLGYFGKLAFHELYYVVLAIWAFQFIFSSVWLRYFRFGPLEWLWRSLTYWQRQPMRRRTESAVGTVAVG